MNPWWLLLLLPTAGMVGFFLCAALTISQRVERLIALERENDWLRERLNEQLH